MKNNLQQKVALSLLAGAMLFGTGYIANTSIAYAASASKDINIQPNISADDNLDGLTVSKQAENNKKAENNTIIISGGKAYDVYAAVTGGGDAVGNTAQMSGGTVAYLGGAATDYGDGDDGSVISNKVIMSDGKAQEVVGGEAFGTGTVETNCVTMTGGEAQNVYGGATYNSSATGNYVEISGKAIVTGSGDNGYEEDGVKTTNKGVYGAISGDPKGDNEVTFGSLENNSVKISGAAHISNAYGAYSFGGADVIGNSVELMGNATVSGDVYGGYSKTGSVTGNTVKIGGNATVSGNVYGGYSKTGAVISNIVDIGGNATVIGNVYGGTAPNTENEINLSGNANVDNANLFGYDKKTSTVSFSRTLSQKADSSGNILTIKGWSGSVKQINNFYEIRFTEIDLDNLKYNNTVLTVGNSEKSDLSNTVINVKDVNFKSGTEINAGTTLNLIASSDSKKLNIDKENVKFGRFMAAGVAQEGTGELYIDDNGNIVQKITEVHEPIW